MLTEVDKQWILNAISEAIEELENRLQDDIAHVQHTVELDKYSELQEVI